MNMQCVYFVTGVGGGAVKRDGVVNGCPGLPWTGRMREAATTVTIRTYIVTKISVAK